MDRKRCFYSWLTGIAILILTSDRQFNRGYHFQSHSAKLILISPQVSRQHESNSRGANISTLRIIVASLSAKPAARAEDAVVDAGEEATKLTMEWLRNRLPGDTSSVLEQLEEVPDSPSRGKRLQV